MVVVWFSYLRPYYEQDACPARLRFVSFPARVKAARLSAFQPPHPLPTSGMRKTALLGFFSGVVLGCLFGAVMGVSSGGNDRPQEEMLGVNPNTGKPQLHIKGKPEIK